MPRIPERKIRIPEDFIESRIYSRFTINGFFDGQHAKANGMSEAGLQKFLECDLLDNRYFLDSVCKIEDDESITLMDDNCQWEVKPKVYNNIIRFYLRAFTEGFNEKVSDIDKNKT